MSYKGAVTSAQVHRTEECGALLRERIHVTRVKRTRNNGVRLATNLLQIKSRLQMEGWTPMTKLLTFKTQVTSQS